MAVSHNYGIKVVGGTDDPKPAPRMSIDPRDFAAIGDLARSIAGCSMACIHVNGDGLNQPRTAFFPDKPGLVDLPPPLLAQPEARSLRMEGEEWGASLRLAGAPHLAYWTGIPLKSQSGRLIGVLGVMDENPVELSDEIMLQLTTLAQILSTGMWLAGSVVRVLARRTLALIEDVGELDEGAASPALLGLIRYASGVLPSGAESMAMRIAGLADLKNQSLVLTPVAEGILRQQGFQPPEAHTLRTLAGTLPEIDPEPNFKQLARLRIGEKFYDIARWDDADRMAYRLSGGPEDWHPLTNGLEEGWPEIAAEIIKLTGNATLDYVRMHMIHNRDAEQGSGNFHYDLYGMSWIVRGTPDHAEVCLPGEAWMPFDAANVSPTNPREFSARAALTAYPDIEDRIGHDVYEWTKRIAAGAEIQPVFS